MNRLESMSVLLAVVDAGSLSAAGGRLGMALATVSRKVSDLESELKARLLIRAAPDSRDHGIDASRVRGRTALRGGRRHETRRGVLSRQSIGGNPSGCDEGRGREAGGIAKCVACQQSPPLSRRLFRLAARR